MVHKSLLLLQDQDKRKKLWKITLHLGPLSPLLWPSGAIDGSPKLRTKLSCAAPLY